MLKISIAATAVALVLSAAAANANTVAVTDASGTPSATHWGTVPGEDSGGGSANITGTMPRSGNGSVELTGDRARLQLGIQYAPFTTDLMPLSSVTGLSFDWMIASDSVSGYSQDATPALRLLVQDGSQRSELVWEGAYNGTYGNTATDTWYSTGFGDDFYQYVAGSGVTLSSGAQVNQALTDWIANNYSSNAYVAGISIGVGSGFLNTYHAFADNVTLGTVSGDTTYNFELGAVPEPASWAMMVMGFGLLGGALRRRRTMVRFAA